MNSLPIKVKELLAKKVFIHLATMMPDGSPQVSPVWVDVEGDTIVINTAEGRIKDRNMQRDPRVGISATDPDNPYHAIMIRGRVVQSTREGADAHIDRLAKKYLGLDKYPGHKPGEVRVIYRIQSESVGTMN